MKTNDLSRSLVAQNCLLGGAIGDALGAPIEFMSLSEITQEFGPMGLQDYAVAYGRHGAITDDTQMTLFTAEGLMRAKVRINARGIGEPSLMVHHAYLRWYGTQVKPHHLVFEPHGFLFSCPELFSTRAPGITCLSALEGAEDLGQPAENDSKGCGGVMRVAPVALFLGDDLGEKRSVYAYELAVKCCAYTHGHPTGQHAGGAFSFILHRLLAGDSLESAIEQCLVYIEAIPEAKEVYFAIRTARDAALKGGAADILESLGAGWVAEEALAIGLYASLCAKGFSDGVLLAVNHSGDSDSTGSIAGNILGIVYGLEEAPGKWKCGLELSGLIAEVADDLVKNAKEIDWEKYPGS
jgi:ADP-ribosylglycohydrolase